MVNSKLPLPILKYLEITPEVLDNIIHQYPFYILPLVARVLNRYKSDGTDLEQLNFFGFNTHKLTNYAATSIDQKTWTQESDKTIHEATIEQEEPQFTLQSAEMSGSSDSESSNPEIETNLNELDSPKSDMDKEILAVEMNISHTENGEDVEVSENQDNNPISDSEHMDVPTELNEDIVQLKEMERVEYDHSSIISDAIHIDRENIIEEVQSEEENEESLDTFDLSQFGVQLLDIGKEPLDIEIDFQETTADEELAEKLLLDNTEELIQSESNDTPISTENNLQQPILEEPIQLDSISDHPLELDRIELNTPNLSVNESIIFEDSAQSDDIQFDQSQDVEEDESLNTQNIDDTQPAEINDFSGWLSKFSHGSGDTESILPIKNIIESTADDTDELDRSIQLTVLETTYSNMNDHKINHDNELEGVLKDNFFKTQVEIKKANRKTPSEMRIQDEAQLSLQPLDIVSETLAVLYTQQGNTVKAIEIYEKLIALIPEKSSFFALQIQNLRKS